jgi:aerobic C4-dicarboxylate transport protein
MIGNAVATVVIGAWEKDIDRVRANQVLNGEVTVTLDETEAVPEPAAPARA